MLGHILALVIPQTPVPSDIRGSYDKFEYMIPMRDGKRLYTSVYVPKNKAGEHPIMLERTPYSAGPYGKDAFKPGFRGSKKFVEAGYIYAFQDVRGRYMSEGEFVNVRPQLTVRRGSEDIDESTDTYDTVDYLIKNVKQNNHRVGIWGISYPGFYAGVATPNTHPALKAASPQAPVSDWFIGDDFHHNGAFFLQDAFSFLNGFGQPRPVPTETPRRGEPIELGGDAYKYFLEMGPLPNFDKNHYKGQVSFWNDMMNHPNYDEFWQSRSLPSTVKNVRCAVMTVGGFFDAEDCWGAQNLFKGIEKLNPGIENSLVAGPWYHGGWARSGGEFFGDIDFGQKTSTYYQDNIEFPFFESHLRGDGKLKRPKFEGFVTGSNRWIKRAQWPPADAKPVSFYLDAGKKLSINTAPQATTGSSSYVSDPANPVPYQGGVLGRRSREYMIDDQRFATSRRDVLSFSSTPLEKNMTLAGPIEAEVFLTTTGSDADLVVKVIDEYPKGTPDFKGKNMDGYQMLVRGEVMRCRYRNSFQNPSPLTPGRTERVVFELPGILHTFKRGHRIMVQIQSSWFPLVDRNPNQFVDIYQAKEEDFIKSVINIQHRPGAASRLTVGSITLDR